MLDLGANVTVNPSNLLQFALMGYCYFSIIENKTRPKIGILNIGTENNKGLEFLQEASDLISKSFFHQNAGYYGEKIVKILMTCGGGGINEVV